MKTILIILAVMVFDWGLGYLLSSSKKKKQKRDEDLFIYKLELLLKHANGSQKERIDKAKELCRNTEGKMAAGAYFALDYVDAS